MPLCCSISEGCVIGLLPGFRKRLKDDFSVFTAN